MPVFAVMLRGENFEMEMEGSIKRLGFFTTRFVRARSEIDAKVQAIEMVRKHDGLRAALRRSVYTPRIFLESIERRPWWHAYKTQHGLIFRDMNKDQQ